MLIKHKTVGTYIDWSAGWQKTKVTTDGNYVNPVRKII